MDALSTLINALRALPGVGPRSAQRMAYHLLQGNRQQGLHIAHALDKAMSDIVHCSLCRNFCEQHICNLCLDEKRNNQLLCVVEHPSDIHAIEQSRVFNGCYFVLMGKISPLDGIGPDEIHLNKLYERVHNHGVDEIIIALSPGMESHTTAHFIRQLFQDSPCRITKLAQGIPSGGALEYLDGHTIGTAFSNRALLHD